MQLKIIYVTTLLHTHHVMAFSSRQLSPLGLLEYDLRIGSKNYQNAKHFVKRGNNDQSAPGSELFPEKGSSYVPLGMTAEEYAKIKKKDSDKLKKMDFGYWGPRFAKSERPDGDWMAMPSLWTRGYDMKDPVNGSSLTRNMEAQKSMKNGKNNSTIHLIKQLIPIYFLAFLSVEMLATAAFLMMKKRFPPSLMALTAFQAIKRSYDIASLTSIIWSKLTLFKIMLATTLVKPFILGIDTCYRRFLWSPRKAISLSTFGFAGLLTISTLIVKIFSG